jgi:hypothetical protein
MTFAIPPRVPAQSANNILGARKKVSVKTEEVRVSKQGHWTERVSQRQEKEPVKSLEHEMVKLRLEPVSSSANAEVVLTRHTKFSAALWSGIAWVTLLQPNKNEE